MCLLHQIIYQERKMENLKKCNCGHGSEDHVFQPWRRVCLFCDCMRYRSKVERKNHHKKHDIENRKEGAERIYWR